VSSSLRSRAASIFPSKSNSGALAGRVGPRSSTESQVNDDLTRTVDQMSLAKAEGLLTGTSHSDIESYQATMEDWVLENDDDLYQSRVQGQEENVVVKYLSWRTCMSLHGHRCDEGGSYCPDARDIKVPQETENWERGPDGSPKHIEITYCW
jgi:hypothetical protein